MKEQMKQASAYDVYLKKGGILRQAIQISAKTYSVGLVISLVVLVCTPYWLRWCFLYATALITLTSIFASVAEHWRFKPRVSTRGKAVLISGCDTGFGHYLALRLDKLGLQVFAGCLFPDGPGAKELINCCSERLHVLPLDVTLSESVQNAKKVVEENIGENKFWALVNNAGINKGTEFILTKMEDIKSILDVNTMGVIRLTKAFLPLLCRNKGRVVSVASSAGRVSLLGLAPYCASKAAVIALCEGLRLEVSKFDVRVITIEPLTFKTAISDKGINKSIAAKTWMESSDEVRQLFPENYNERYKESINTFIDLTISNNPQEVVDCLEEAILALNPKYNYVPGSWFARIVMIITQKLPTAISESLLPILLGDLGNHTKLQKLLTLRSFQKYE